jgi:hypothetical protein
MTSDSGMAFVVVAHLETGVGMEAAITFPLTDGDHNHGVVRPQRTRVKTTPEQSAIDGFATLTR